MLNTEICKRIVGLLEYLKARENSSEISRALRAATLQLKNHKLLCNVDLYLIFSLLEVARCDESRVLIHLC